jgi:hypothetical protein
VRIDISRLQDGEMLGPIPAWRGRPIFVVKRSEALLAALNEDPIASPIQIRKSQSSPLMRKMNTARAAQT